MSRICPTCNRPKEEHQVEKVVTATGRKNVRVCSLAKRRGPVLQNKPPAYLHDGKQR
jgi:hypothetical protein